MTTIDSATQTTDSTAVLEVLRQVYAAWTDNDADAFAALYVEDATVVMPGVFHPDRSALRDRMAAGFAGPLKGSRPFDEPLSVRVFGGNSAIVVSRSGIIMAGEDTFPAEREVVATWALAKQDGRWLIAAYANAPAN